AAARLDDVLNLIPARIATLSLVAGAVLVGESARGALAILRRDRGRTESPNAGWTMAAMAGALGVVLEKPGAYRLGDGALPAAAVDDHVVSERLLLVRLVSAKPLGAHVRTPDPEREPRGRVVVEARVEPVPRHQGQIVGRPHVLGARRHGAARGQARRGQDEVVPERGLGVRVAQPGLENLPGLEPE